MRVLGAALHSLTSLRSLSLAHGGLRAADLTPLFSLLQGGAGAPPVALRALSLRDNKLGDVGARQLCDALSAGGRAGACQLQQLDIAANQLSVGAVGAVAARVLSGTVLSWCHRAARPSGSLGGSGRASAAARR